MRYCVSHNAVLSTATLQRRTIQRNVCILYEHVAVCHIKWLGSVVVRASDLWSEFHSQPCTQF